MEYSAGNKGNTIAIIKFSTQKFPMPAKLFNKLLTIFHVIYYSLIINWNLNLWIKTYFNYYFLS